MNDDYDINSKPKALYIRANLISNNYFHCGRRVKVSR